MLKKYFGVLTMLLISLFASTMAQAQTATAPSIDWGYIIGDSSTANLPVGSSVLPYQIATGGMDVNPQGDFLVTAHNYLTNNANLSAMAGPSSFTFPAQVGGKDSVFNFFDVASGFNPAILPHIGASGVNSEIVDLSFNNSGELYYLGSVIEQYFYGFGATQINVNLLSSYPTLLNFTPTVFRVPYLTKLNPNGTPAWVVTLSAGDSFKVLKVNKVTGDAYISGETFVSLGAVITDANGNTSMPIYGKFLAKINNNGSLAWVSTDPSFTNNYQKTFDVNNTEVAIITNSTSGTNGWHLVRLNANTGAVLGSYNLVTTTFSQPGDIKYIPGTNDVVISFNSLAAQNNIIDIDPSANVQNVNFSSYAGILVVRYSSAGMNLSPVWVHSFSSPNWVSLKEMIIGDCDNILVSVFTITGVTTSSVILRKIHSYQGALAWSKEIALLNGYSATNVRLKAAPATDAFFVTVDSQFPVGGTNHSVSTALVKFTDTDVCP